jgi:hypothetical protein
MPVVGCPEPHPSLPPIPVSKKDYPKWTPDDPSESHPSHEDVEEAENEDSRDCGKIGRAIDVLVRDLKFRRWDMQRHGGGDQGHRAAYRKRQEALIRLLKRAKDQGCPYNPAADAEATQGPNHPSPFY